MSQCFVQDGALLDAFNAAESWYQYPGNPLLDMSDSEFGSMAMEAHGVTGGAVISVDQTNGQCLTVGDFGDLIGGAGPHLTFPGDPMFYNTPKVESLGYRHLQPCYQPTCKQEFLTTNYSNRQYLPNCQLESPWQRTATGSLSSVTSTVDSGPGDSTRGSPYTPLSASPTQYDVGLLDQYLQKTSEDASALEKYSDPFPVAAARPDSLATCAATSVSISTSRPTTTTCADKDSTSQEDRTDRLIRLGIQRHHQQLAATAAAPAKAAAATLKYPRPAEVTMDQPVEEKNEQCGNSNEESMADVNPPVKEETSETLMSEGNEAKNSYMLRHREDSKMWRVDEEGSDVESNSGESEATSDDNEEEASDHDQYEPKPERNGHRGHSYGSTGSRLSHTAHSPQLWEFLLMVLDDTGKKSVMGWKDKTEGVFKIYNSASAARLWGRHKNKSNMNYDKMSRAMRYYYSKGIFEKVPGRLIYKFSQQARQKYAHNKASFLYNRSVPQTVA